MFPWNNEIFDIYWNPQITVTKSSMKLCRYSLLQFTERGTERGEGTYLAAYITLRLNAPEATKQLLQQL